MKKTKIDWCDSTINCVYGCPNGCEWCYGNVMNKRFHFCKDWNVPEWKPEHLKDFYAKKPRSIFVDSMSDIGTWQDEWLYAVLDAMRENQQHRYLALTKTNTYRLYSKMLQYSKEKGASAMLYLGKSVTTQAQADILYRNRETTDFLSVEPLLERIDMSKIIRSTATVIIGAETGNRKGKVIPQKSWVDEIVNLADESGIRVFMKGSLREIMGDDFRQDSLPWEVRR